MKESFGRIRRKFLHYLKIGSSLVFIFILFDSFVTPAGARISLLMQAGTFMIFAVAGSAGFAVYQEIRWRRARKRLEALGIL
ncbi:MAG TPA: hypothetical protein VMD53_02075 [Rhizomicrobium sp.]|nr:hypothetical protein [Rhizomicrobium sp.]